jgi:predicted transcriptional regulator
MTDKIYGSLFAIFMFIVVILWATFIVNIIERLYPSEHKQNKQRTNKEEYKKPKKGKDFLANKKEGRTGTGG